MGPQKTFKKLNGSSEKFKKMCVFFYSPAAHKLDVTRRDTSIPHSQKATYALGIMDYMIAPPAANYQVQNSKLKNSNSISDFRAQLHSNSKPQT